MMRHNTHRLLALTLMYNPFHFIQPISFYNPFHFITHFISSADAEVVLYEAAKLGMSNNAYKWIGVDGWMDSNLDR